MSDPEASENQSELQSEAKAAATKPPASRKRRWKRYVLLGAVLLLAAGEISLRLLADRNSKFNIVIGAGREWDPYRKQRLRKNYHSGSLHTNSKGILGPEFDARKPPGSFRIVTLGDSCSFYPPERNYPTFLEEALRQARPDRDILVINASCPGYTARQARIWYEQEIDGYDHDLLIIYLGWNDMGQYNPDGLVYKLEETGYVQEPNLVQRALLNCYLLRLVYVAQSYWQRHHRVSLEPLDAEEAKRYGEFYPTHFEENLITIIERAQKRERRVCLLNYAGLVRESPTPDEQRRMHFPRGMGRRLHKYLVLKKTYERALSAVAERTGTAIIDIAALFPDPQSRQVFSDSVHFHPRGAEIIGRHVAGEIEPYIEQTEH